MAELVSIYSDTGSYINKPARARSHRSLDSCLCSIPTSPSKGGCSVWTIIITIVLKLESRVLPSFHKPLILVNPLILPFEISIMSGLFKLSLSVLVIGIAIRIMRRKSRLPLPPGPRGLPIIGNAFDIPSVNMAQTYLRWAKDYGTCYSYLPNR